MKTIVTLNSFEDLVEVFPHLTLKNIMSLFCDALDSLHDIDEELGTTTDVKRQSDLLSDLVPFQEARDFLGTWLALLFCEEHGVMPKRYMND